MSRLKVFFALFPGPKKSARVAAHTSAELGTHSSSSTLSTHQMAPGTSGSHDEPTVWYDEELEQAWCHFVDLLGRSFWRLLTTDHSQWEPPWER